MPQYSVDPVPWFYRGVVSRCPSVGAGGLGLGLERGVGVSRTHQDCWSSWILQMAASWAILLGKSWLDESPARR